MVDWFEDSSMCSGKAGVPLTLCSIAAGLSPTSRNDRAGGRVLAFLGDSSGRGPGHHRKIVAVPMPGGDFRGQPA